MDTLKKRAWLSWISVGILAVLCGVLALLQNHWITEVSLAERERLQQQLQTELSHLSREFNGEITNACASLLPSEQEIDALGKGKAYSDRYVQWKQSHDHIFSRIALAIPGRNGMDLSILNPTTAQFEPASWPPEWSSSWDNLIALPHPDFRNHGREGVPAGWLLLEINLDYVRSSLIPELLHRYLATGGKLDYQAEVIDGRDPSKVIFETGPTPAHIGNSADASIPLFDINYGSIMRPRGEFFRGFHPGPPPPEGPRPEMGFPGPPFARGLEPPPGGPGGPGGQSRWRLLVRHQAGSLEAVVSRARFQNLATSLGVLLLIVATVGTLLRFSRRAQQLAETQMNFVAGVSHELRTPLTVIRTAAFNLRGKLANRPEQVERYGKLIQDESEKLGALVEQVLRFAGTRAGHVIREREPVAVETLIDEGICSSGVALDASGIVVEKHIEPGLPVVLADELALKYAIQNLVDNAVKYGTGASNWICISAARSADRNGAMIEIRVADKGPGIPPEEQKHIFDPFFRGRRAVHDQVHGTGLGLSLVKKIVEAHGGTISLHSEPMQGAEFLLRLPAAPLELQHEFAHPVG